MFTARAPGEQQGRELQPARERPWQQTLSWEVKRDRNLLGLLFPLVQTQWIQRLKM